LVETDVLAEERNYHGLTRLSADLVQHPATRPRSRRVILDIDSSESPVHGTQEQSAYNGHFESVCYHPLFVFNPEGDCLAAKLRPGNVHSAEGWDEVLLPIDPLSPERSSPGSLLLSVRGQLLVSVEAVPRLAIEVFGLAARLGEHPRPAHQGERGCADWVDRSRSWS